MAVHENSLKNLENRVKFSDRTDEELLKITTKGGINSGITRRRKKTMRESLEILLNMKISSGQQCDIETVENYAALKGQNITVEQAMLIAQMKKALNGDTQALAFLRDTSGQKPDDNLVLTGNMEVKNPYDQLSVEELKALAKKCENEGSKL